MENNLAFKYSLQFIIIDHGQNGLCVFLGCGSNYVYDDCLISSSIQPTVKHTPLKIDFKL